MYAFELTRANTVADAYIHSDIHANIYTHVDVHSYSYTDSNSE